MRTILLLSEIVESDEVLPRAELPKLTRQYAEEMRLGAQFPPIVVFQDESRQRWLAAGRHRKRAMELIGEVRSEVDLRKGSKADATWWAAGDNREHGMPLSNHAKRQAVINALRTESIRDTFTAGAIAAQIGVKAALVQRIKKKLDYEEKPWPKVGVDGRRYRPTTKPKPKSPEQKIRERNLNRLDKWLKSVIDSPVYGEAIITEVVTRVNHIRSLLRPAIDEEDSTHDGQMP